MLARASFGGPMHLAESALGNRMVYLSAHGRLRSGRATQQLAERLDQHLMYGRRMFILDLRECRLGKRQMLASVIANVLRQGGKVRPIAVEDEMVRRLMTTNVWIYPDLNEALIGFETSQK